MMNYPKYSKTTVISCDIVIVLLNSDFFLFQIDTCDKCQRFEKVKTMAPELHPIKVTEPWHLLGMDLFGPLKPTKNGYQYVLTVTDYFTKWPEALPLRNKTAAEVATRLVDTFYR